MFVNLKIKEKKFFLDNPVSSVGVYRWLNRSQIHDGAGGATEVYPVHETSSRVRPVCRWEGVEEMGDRGPPDKDLLKQKCN